MTDIGLDKERFAAIDSDFCRHAMSAYCIAGRQMCAASPGGPSSSAARCLAHDLFGSRRISATAVGRLEDADAVGRHQQEPIGVHGIDVAHLALAYPLQRQTAFASSS
jgi:hypothetical protein